MRKLIICIAAALCLVQPVKALELVPPTVPEAGREAMPEQTEALSDGFRELIGHSMRRFRPDLTEASRVSLSILAAVMLVSILKTISGPAPMVADLAGTAAIAGNLLLTSDAMIRLGTDTVVELTEYGKLLLPVMTGALAAQGGVTKSAAVYAGTALFSTVLSSLISGVLIPMTYVFLALAVGNGALGEDIL